MSENLVEITELEKLQGSQLTLALLEHYQHLAAQFEFYNNEKSTSAKRLAAAKQQAQLEEANQAQANKEFFARHAALSKQAAFRPFAAPGELSPGEIARRQQNDYARIVKAREELKALLEKEAEAKLQLRDEHVQYRLLTLLTLLKEQRARYGLTLHLENTAPKAYVSPRPKLTPSSGAGEQGGHQEGV